MYLHSIIYIVHKGVLAPIFKAPTPWPSLSHLFEILFPLPFFLFHHLLRYFRQFPLPSRRQPPSCPNPKHQLSSQIHTGSFLDNLEWLLFIKLWWQKNFFFSSNVERNLKSKIISKCKNNKPWKNQIGKVPAPLLRRPAPAPYFHPFFNFSNFSPPREVIKIHFSPLKKGGPNYDLLIQFCSSRKARRSFWELCLLTLYTPLHFLIL